MPRVKSDSLFELIKSMDKNEKRHFKVMALASKDKEDSRIVALFDLLNKQESPDEEEILKKDKSLKPSQLSNLKAYLFDKLLQSLRQYHSEKINDIRIREQIDFAQLLIERRLFSHARKCLKKAKDLARLHYNPELQLEIIKLEKNILIQTVDEDPAITDRIIMEVRELNRQINNINIFSNIYIKLNSFYTKIGHIRNEEDFRQAEHYFTSQLPEYEESMLSLWERIYLFRVYAGYYFFTQDFDNAYLYSKNLVKIFEDFPALIRSQPELYITSLNSLLISDYRLMHFNEFMEVNKKLQSVKEMDSLHINENMRIRLQRYYFMHEINKYFMTGNFELGVESILKDQGKEFSDLLELCDKHTAMIFNYKIACMYFGVGNYNMAIRYLHRIINESNPDFREDLHCFARIINLVCHYELGNFDVINYYIINTYKFLLKKDDLHLFQKYIMAFLKNLNNKFGEKELRDAFQKLKEKLVPLQERRFEKRAFFYFDIISWLESKIEKRKVQEIIREKFEVRVN